MKDILEYHPEQNSCYSPPNSPFFLYAHHYFYNDLALVIRIVLYGITTFSILGGILLFLKYLLVEREKLLILKADRLLKEKQASLEITIAPPGSQVIASQFGISNISHKPLHLSPGHQPTQEDKERWRFFQLTQNISKKPELAPKEVSQLTNGTLPEEVHLEHYSSDPSVRNIFLGIGKFPDGQVRPVSAPLSRLVHIAVAGSSGFDKSTFMKSLAWQCINAKENPETVLIDAEGLTFSGLGECTDIESKLEYLSETIQARRELFQQYRGIDSLESYNRLTGENMGYIPVFFDEFGLSAKEYEKEVTLISQGGRKVGVFLIAGSQTWYAKDISSTFRANLSTTVQFYTRSKAQSRVLLGDSAAFEITRPGQAFCTLPGVAGLVELQTPMMGEGLSFKEETQDELFVRLVNEGNSMSEASRVAYGKELAGSHHTKCKRLLSDIK